MVEGADAGDLLGAAPRPVRLVDDHRQLTAVSARIETDRAAVPRRTAGQRIDIGVPALIELRGARNLLGGAPSTARSYGPCSHNSLRSGRRSAATGKQCRAHTSRNNHGQPGDRMPSPHNRSSTDLAA
jgi:hypothetical protein